MVFVQRIQQTQRENRRRFCLCVMAVASLASLRLLRTFSRSLCPLHWVETRPNRDAFGADVTTARLPGVCTCAGVHGRDYRDRDDELTDRTLDSDMYSLTIETYIHCVFVVDKISTKQPKVQCTYTMFRVEQKNVLRQR